MPVGFWLGIFAIVLSAFAFLRTILKISRRRSQGNTASSRSHREPEIEVPDSLTWPVGAVHDLYRFDNNTGQTPFEVSVTQKNGQDIEAVESLPIPQIANGEFLSVKYQRHPESDGMERLELRWRNDAGDQLVSRQVVDRE